MKLDRLEVSGFKSFVDPLAVSFAPGITGIVGPNGCGKSNLIDAVTWVLGEQSARTLRAQTMEDVIFNGSESRRPLGMAEVTLIFAATPGHPAAEDGKITISRRVFRSGESLYRLNGRAVRLKDIRSLLFDTGLGLRAYSIIEQGKIGMILSGKPQERRSLIEEAAGITRYRVRREHAEVKLAEAAGNLLRLDDILAEVERNLRSLRRQAGAARRYEERRRELEQLERLWLGHRLATLERELQARRNTVASLQDQESRWTADLACSEAEVVRRREQVHRDALALAELERSMAQLGATLATRREQAFTAQRGLGELETQRLQGQQRADSRVGERDIQANRLALVERELAELEQQCEQAVARVSDDGVALTLLEEKVRQAEQEVRTHRDQLLHRFGELEQARSQLHRAQLARERAELGLQHLESRLAAESAEEARLEQERKGASDTVATSEAELQEVEAEIERLRDRLEQDLAHEAQLGEALRVAEASWVARSERRRGLLELEELERQGGEALLDRLAQLGLKSTRPLALHLKPLPGWERSLDFFLGDLEEAMVLPPGLPLAAAVGQLVGKPDAPEVVLLSTRSDEPRILGREGKLELPLGQALGLPSELAAALPPAFLVGDSEEAEQLAREHPGIAFVTREGAWFQNGVAHVAGTGSAPGHLARTSELTELEDELAKKEAQLAELRTSIDQAVATRAETAAELHRVQESANALRQRNAAARARVSELDNQLARLGDQRAKLEQEREPRQKELEQARHDQARHLERLRAEELQHRNQEAILDRLQEQLEELRQDRELARARGAGQRGTLDLIRERIDSRRAERDRCCAELARLEREDASWAQQLEQILQEHDEFEQRLATLQHQIVELEQEQVRLTNRLSAQANVLEQERSELQEQENGIISLRAQLEELRGQILELRVSTTGLEHDQQHLLTEVQNRWGSSEGLAGTPEALTDLEPAELGERCQKLRAELDAMGPVNVLAAEELVAEEERFRMLTAQRTDVARSIESLRQTIREINQTSSERFRETFVQLNEHFHRTFVELFRGGEAAMRLLEEEDPLESAIEIVARPPGKRLQNLMLLSGGEKALTAIALLFALFRIKASPFCILDEVDAPLDDVNTLRFVTLLRQLARETQVLVVTHNKLTMEACGRLFGVTMEERGVSKLVEVALSEIFPEPELAPVAGG